MSNQKDIIVDDGFDEIDFDTDADAEERLAIEAMIETKMIFTLGEVAHALNKRYHPAFGRTVVTAVTLHNELNNVFMGVVAPDDEKVEEFDYDRYARLSYEEAVEDVREYLEDQKDLGADL